MRGILHVTGIVQGVGFRPFVYRLAKKFGLKGYILNMGNFGVKIEVEGKQAEIAAFNEAIRTSYPPIARIDSMELEWDAKDQGYADFTILKSMERSGDIIVLPPDVAICDDCLAEFNDPNKFPSRYYHYPFIACSVCGPRYTTVVDLPYDRLRTTMDIFPFCVDCAREYQDPTDRRYHAQTYACRVCGPKFTLETREGVSIQTKNTFHEAAKLLEEGKILAVMGIGGVHLTCKPEDDVVLELRRRKKKRKYKPFAVMAPSLEKARTFAKINPIEEDLLTSFRRPIVLLEQDDGYYLSKELAPGLSNIGVFLPYSGIHCLLFRKHDFPALVMTSGNVSNRPMAIDRVQVVKELQDLADAFLLHDRPIYQRVDDSVVRVIADKAAIIRRSRGYVPEHVDIPFDTKEFQVIAFGPELHSTGAVLKKSRCYPTQHIGDVTSLELLDFLDSAVSHLMKLLRMAAPDAVVCDLNPVFLSRQLAQRKAEEYGCKLYEIQHHHAHLLGLMAEHKIMEGEEIVGIILDGVGYGKEGEVWGGELFIASYGHFESLAQLQLQPMPGGDRCVYYPVRMLAAILSSQLDRTELEELLKTDYLDGLPYRKNELKTLFSQLETKTGLYYSSGMGRVLDAVSALLHVCNERTYEGEPAIRLEHFARLGKKDTLKFRIPLTGEKKVTIGTTELLIQALEYLQQGKKPHDIAASVQYNLAKKVVEVALELAERRGIQRVGFSGGVAYNDAITATIKKEVQAAGKIFLQPSIIPPGDAGVSTGQCIYGIFHLLRG